MLLPTSGEIEVLGVADRGTPNKERIIARTLVAINCSQFLLAIGWAGSEGVNIVPNLLFTFKNEMAEEGSWIIVYTGKGETEISRLPTTHEPAYVFHWGFEHVLFTSSEIVPVFFRVTEIDYEGSPFGMQLSAGDRKVFQPQPQQLTQ